MDQVSSYPKSATFIVSLVISSVVVVLIVVLVSYVYSPYIGNNNTTVQHECFRNVRTWKGGHGMVELHRSDLKNIINATQKHNGSKMLQIVDARATREQSFSPFSERGKAIIRLQKEKPLLTLVDESIRGSNDDIITLTFRESSVYFPVSLFLDVCV